MKKSKLRKIIRESIKELINEQQDINIEPEDVAKFPLYISAPCDCLTPDAFQGTFPVIDQGTHYQTHWDQTWVYGQSNNPHPAGIYCYTVHAGGRINGQDAQIGDKWR